MVPCLHQSNVYIKKKLQELTVQKCIPLVGAKIALTSAGLQTTPSHVSQYGPENGNLRKSGSTFHHGTMFAPKQCLYQKEATGMESPKTIFAPKQCLAQKELTGMESPKLHASSRCKNHTYLCRTANYPVSCKPAKGRER